MSDQDKRDLPTFSQEEETNAGDVVNEASKHLYEGKEKIDVSENAKQSGRITDEHAGWRTPNETGIRKGSSGDEEKDITD
jgi:hypothetical protein